MTVVDIEDVLREEEAEVMRKSNGYKPAQPIVSRRAIPEQQETKNGAVHQSFVPGKDTVFIKTWGCAHNSSDSEYMAGLLGQAGYKISYSPEGASIWLLNSCTVKTPSEQQLKNRVAEADSGGVPVVLCGCVPQAASQTPWLKGYSIVGVQQIDRIVEVVEAALQGNTVRLLSSKRKDGKRLGGASLDLPKIRKNPLIEILAINTGCLNHCTYCKTKQARGDLASYPIEDIVDRAKKSFQEGVKEIWLTSEDLGAYGRDIGTSLPELLFALIEVLPDGTMLRAGMTNPPYILDHLDEIAVALNHPRVYGFLHVPVQAGSDAVLRDMKREYTAEEFRRVVDFMREKVPGISIATDVICGFPTETAEDFEETLDLVRRYKFPSLFINQYFPRPNTPASRMKRVDTREVKRRTKLISDLFASYHPYEGREGSDCRVLVTEIATDGNSMVGHSKNYEQVLLPNRRYLMGQMLRCRITETGKHYMIGRPWLSDSCFLFVAYYSSRIPRPKSNIILPCVLALSAAVAARYALEKLKKL